MLLHLRHVILASVALVLPLICRGVMCMRRTKLEPLLHFKATCEGSAQTTEWPALSSAGRFCLKRNSLTETSGSGRRVMIIPFVEVLASSLSDWSCSTLQTGSPVKEQEMEVKCHPPVQSFLAFASCKSNTLLLRSCATCLSN